MKPSYQSGGQEFTVQLEMRGIGGYTREGVTRECSFVPLVRNDGAHILVLTKVVVKGPGDHVELQRDVRNKDMDCPKARILLTSDEYAKICSEHRRINGAAPRQKISVAYSNYMVHPDMGRTKYAYIVRKEFKASGKVSPAKKDNGEIKRTPAPSLPEGKESPLTAIKQQMMDAVLLEVGESIPERIMDGLERRLETLKNDIISEVLTRLTEHVDALLSNRTPAPKAETGKAAETKQAPPDSKQVPPLHACLGKYLSADKACDGNGSGVPCPQRERCMCVQAELRVRGPVVVTADNVKELEDAGLARLTGPEGSEAR